VAAILCSKRAVYCLRRVLLISAHMAVASALFNGERRGDWSLTSNGRTCCTLDEICVLGNNIVNCLTVPLFVSCGDFGTECVCVCVFVFEQEGSRGKEGRLG
jgi:hypothetical protein